MGGYQAGGQAGRQLGGWWLLARLSGWQAGSWLFGWIANQAGKQLGGWASS